jgi:cell division protein FtsX
VCEEMTGCIEVNGLVMCLIGIIIGAASAWVMWDNRNTYDTFKPDFLASFGILIGIICFALGFITSILPLLPCVVIV